MAAAFVFWTYIQVILRISTVHTRFLKEVETWKSKDGKKCMDSRKEGALEEPNEDQFHRDDAHRDRNSLLCDGSLDIDL